MLNTMESMKQLYRIGLGPSSSHTMAPMHAAEDFLARTPDAASYRVVLYGSLAATGRGHYTDRAIESVLGKTGKPVEILWKPDIFLRKHPNAMTFSSLDQGGSPLCSWNVYSTGGGALRDDESWGRADRVYELDSMDSILEWCRRKGAMLWEYAADQEGEELFSYLKQVWEAMRASVKTGLEHEGVLPGELRLPRKAAQYYARTQYLSGSIGRRSRIYAYALAVSEENAGGGQVVTAPTCGASGVLPAVLYYLQETHRISQQRIIRSLAAAGIVGNIVKHRASISGAEVGCQGEIGTACAMASAAAAHLMGGSNYQIEYAAEMGLEHHLGLTCDPVYGLVQIPCIERNAMAAARALNHMAFSLLSDGRHFISFDDVVSVMKETGEAIPSLYRETSMGGLAALERKTDSL